MGDPKIPTCSSNSISTTVTPAIRPSHSRSRIHRHSRGFALIVTLSLMILLTVIAVGLLSLSSISLRSSSQGDAMQAARANARMALMLAIGDLQKQLGPDTRVSARADILKPENAPLLGAWKSWEGSDHDATGRPVSPGDYASKKQDRFLSWLVSGDPKNLASSGTLPPTATSATRIPMVSTNTLPNGAPANLQVHLDPVLVTNTRKGAYAWWVGGENQKALLPQPENPSASKTAADWANAMKSSAIADTKPFGLESLRTDSTPATKAVTLKQTDLINQTGASPVSRQNFLDLSTFSVGLLTNTATGGWRKDLSLFTEKFENQPASGLSLFRLTPEKETSQGKATTSQPLAAKSMLYPWSDYRSTGSVPGEQAGAVASWANLADYACMYRKFGSGNSFSIASSPMTSMGNAFNYLHTVKPMPVVARLQWVYAYAMTNASTNQQRVTLKLTPVVTLWNPYNVTLNVGKLVFTVSQLSTMPVGLEYDVEYSDGVVVKSGGYRGMTGNGVYRSVQNNSQPQFLINSVGAIAPGGTKVFSITGSNPNTLIGRTLEAGPGFNPNNGHFIQLSSANSIDQIYSPRVRNAADRARTIKTRVKLDNTITAPGSLAGKYGLRLVVRDDSVVAAGGTDRLDGSNGNEMIYQMIAPSTVASSAVINVPDVSVSNITTNGYPFMSLTFGLRAIDNLNDPGDPHDKNRLAKGFVQTSPTATNSDMTINPATSNRVNAAYDFNVLVHSATDDVVPNTGGTATSGYLMTGLTAGTGLARLIAADIPVKPLASLGELQGWDMRFGNPAPPFAYNVIGNSDATPLMPSNAVDLGSSPATNLEHDDSYCANHILFDDWFFSSINEGNPTQFGGGGSLKTNYTNFLKGTAPLANSSYRPVGEDVAMAQASGSQADSLFSQNVAPADSWRKIASRLEVMGMFNVNSTSVTAWKALLGHARGQQVPQYGAGAISLNPKTDYPATRYSVAGDTRADSDSQGTAGDGRANATQYTGYRVFTEPMINELAEKIVVQVRKRAPFLSLSEFVNRQLSSDPDLAVAGAIQTALNQMEGTIHGDIDAAKANGDPGASGYKFAAAAVGSSAHGMPGWVRQADLLRPLAPILSARDDTFIVRSYGDARDATGKVTATAHCEAVVRRTRNYCDSIDAADTGSPPTAAVNQMFGRKFEIVSFRWLSKSEI